MVTVAGCATTPKPSSTGAALDVVAAENIWGDLAARVGGDLVSVHNVINSPDADPHDYEPTATDGIAIARADLVIVNGLGYDTWAGKLARANKVKGDHLFDVGDITGHHLGDNPHRWYSPSNVSSVVDALVERLGTLDPRHRADYERNATQFRAGEFRRYTDAVGALMRYRGVPVGASESILAPLAQDIGLDLVTPEGFLDAVSEGAEPTVGDKQLADRQIRRHEIRVYVYNSQNASPDVQAQVNLATAAGIPVVTVTETLTPKGASFVEWQVGQMERLATALAKAGGLS
jgi:zinc/manganese transport system substrate-binding protein